MSRYTINEGENSLNRVLLMMNYDMGKTLSENISEQPESVMDRRLGITSKNAKALGMSEKDYEKALNKSMYGNPLDFKWDHDTAGWAELGLTIGGMILIATGVGAPIGAGMMAAGTAIGVADAVVYFDEGDTFMGWTMLALQLIPGGELAKFIKTGRSAVNLAKHSDEAIKLFKEINEVGFKKLSKKAQSGTLTKVEKEVFEMLGESLGKQGTKITKEMVKRAFVKLQLSLYEFTLEKGLSTALPILVSLGKFGVKTTLQIGGTVIGVDLLYKFLTTPESVARQVRNESDFGKLLDLGYGLAYDKSPKIVKSLYLNIWKKLYNEDGTPNYSEQANITKEIMNQIDLNTFKDNEILNSLRSDDIDSLQKEGLSILNSVDVEWSQEQLEKFKTRLSKPTTFEDLMSGRRTIRKGQKGLVVREIQKMLSQVKNPKGEKYDLGTSGKNKDGVDGDFGDTMETAVHEFQIDYDLNDFDGIVGSETSKKLYQLYSKEK